jgi:transposase-like protein
METNILIVVCPECNSDLIQKDFMIGQDIKIFTGFKCLDCNHEFNKKEAVFEEVSDGVICHE